MTVRRVKMDARIFLINVFKNILQLNRIRAFFVFKIGPSILAYSKFLPRDHL